jgi:hypothetical protein
VITIFVSFSDCCQTKSPHFEESMTIAVRDSRFRGGSGPFFSGSGWARVGLGSGSGRALVGLWSGSGRALASFFRLGLFRARKINN